MIAVSDGDVERIDFVSRVRGIDPRILEKDIIVTRAVGILSGMAAEDTALLFCGGTCLAKCHGLIKRMSEDIDFKFVLRADASKSQKRRLRGLFRRDVQAMLESAGFDASDFRARDNNNFFVLTLGFSSRYPSWAALRPFARAEFINVEPCLAPVRKSARAMVDAFLEDGGDCEPVWCQDARETLVEKVLGMLRRLGDDRDRYSKSPTLMRHLYDVSRIVESGMDFSGLADVFRKKIGREIESHGAHCAEFARNPEKALGRALESLKSDPVCRDNYESHVVPMLWDDAGSDFDFCLGNFSRAARKLIGSLESQKPNCLRP